MLRLIFFQKDSEHIRICFLVIELHRSFGEFKGFTNLLSLEQLKIENPCKVNSSLIFDIEISFDTDNMADSKALKHLSNEL